MGYKYINFGLFFNLFKGEGELQVKLMNVKYFCKRYMFHCNREERGINSIAMYKGIL